MHTFVQTQTVNLKCVFFIVYKLYLSTVLKNNGKRENRESEHRQIVWSGLSVKGKLDMWQ